MLTLDEKTRLFNALVPVAQRAGATWPRHHTSRFIDHPTADSQLRRLLEELEENAR